MPGTATARASVTPATYGPCNRAAATPITAPTAIVTAAAMRSTTGSGSAQRSTLMRIIPGRDQLDGVWVLQLTSPAGRAEDAVAGLFDAIGSGFRATPG